MKYTTMQDGKEVILNRWKDGSVYLWDCMHCRKHDVLVEKNGLLYLHNTDYDEPELPYKWIHIHHIAGIEDYFIDDIRPGACECKKGQS